MNADSLVLLQLGEKNTRLIKAKNDPDDYEYQ